VKHTKIYVAYISFMKNKLDYYEQFGLGNVLDNNSPIITKQILVKQEKTKPKKNKSFLGFVFIFAVLLIAIFVAYAFSNLLAFSTVSLYESNVVVVKSYEIYLLNLKEFENKYDAEKYAKTIQLQGGAGIIYFDSKYKVIASCYTSYEDASNVLLKVSAEYAESSISTLSLNRLKLKNTSNEANMIIIDNGLNLFKNVGEKLIDLSIELDSEIKTSSEIKNELLDLYTNSKIVVDNYSEIVANGDEKFSISKAKLQQLIDNLNSLIEKSLTSLRLTSLIKSTAIDCFFLQNELSILIA